MCPLNLCPQCETRDLGQPIWDGQHAVGIVSCSLVYSIGAPSLFLFRSVVSGIDCTPVPNAKTEPEVQSGTPGMIRGRNADSNAGIGHHGVPNGDAVQETETPKEVLWKTGLDVHSASGDQSDS